jgi:gliding motility-associated protein GldM
MGHGKETPRQKMIGMMYLVLTAMLALNVSKEAVEAFKNVDKGLTKTVINYEKKNNLTYEEFERAFNENPVKAGKWRSKAVELKARSGEIFDYLQDIKIEIIKEAEGEDTEAVDGRVVYIDHVEKIDENNIPSQILIGDDENGKANNIRALINDYRQFLIETVDGENITVEESVMESLNTDDGEAPDGAAERWENNTFHALPLVAVITILSKLQVDVRNAETDVLNFLYNQIDASSFKFNKLVPTVITPSSYVMRGNSYQASVFIAATDTTKTPNIYVGEYTTSTNADGTKSYEMVGDYETLEVDDQGYGIYQKPTSSIGPREWGGLINIDAPDGTVLSYPFEAAYIVGAPNVVVSPTAMNVLYVGIDNPIDISVPGVGSNAISANMDNGNIKRGRLEGYRGEWIATPTTAGKEASVNVSAIINGERMRFPPYNFRVQTIPPPVAKFAGIVGEGSVAKNIALAQQGVFAEQPDFLFDLDYTVTKFTVMVTQRGFDRTAPSTSNILTAQQKELISALTRGQKLYLTDIWAVGPDNVSKKIPPVIITIN